MKLNMGETYEERIERLGRWHRWFAWYPVRMTGTHEGRWLEWVERKGVIYSIPNSNWLWEYRPIKRRD